MNKYIDYMTVPEYEFIKRQLEKRLEEEKTEMEQTKDTKTYVELRFILLKIDKIIKKHKK